MIVTFGLQIDMEIAVPFLSVPNKRGLGKNANFANINVAAVILAAMVAVVGTLFGGAARFLKGDKFFDGPLFRTGNKKKKQRRDADQDDLIWEMFGNIDKALLDINFDLTACAQRSICWHVKNSCLNVQEKRARQMDTFISGFIK